MKKLLLFQRCLFATCVIAASGLVFSGCSKNDLIAEQPIQDGRLLTKADAPEVHWRCRNKNVTDLECGFFNSPWREKCLVCEEAHNAYHGGLLVEFFQKVLKNYVDFETGGPGVENINDANIQNRIIIPGGILLDYAPTPWFNTAKALTFYDNLKTLNYYSDPAYAEGVDVGWYRTVRMLYPGISDLTKVESIHTKWLLGDGRLLRDSNGRGLKDGTKAAIDAFRACK